MISDFGPLDRLVYNQIYCEYILAADVEYSRNVEEREFHMGNLKSGEVKQRKWRQERHGVVCYVHLTGICD